MNNATPFEISEFEQLLRKPNGDPTGLAGFFNSGEVWVARVPARLDVMGGIADYSGANVCEAVLGRGMLMALQARTDRTLRIRSVQVGHRSLPVETRIPLDYLTSGDAVGAYAQMRELCLANPLAGLGGLHRRQHFHLAEGGIPRVALRFQFHVDERGADERGHRQFRRRGNRHAVVPQRLSRPQA